MGLQDELGYEHAEVGPVRALLQDFAASRPGAALSAAALHRIDRPVFRWTSGRHTASSLLGGVPILMLTTTGRRSGRARTAPLIGVPFGDDLAVIGSNYGRANTPAWVRNLEAEPRAVVGYRDREVPVMARLADPDETDAVFSDGARVYPGYGHYRDRAAHRSIRAFVLTRRG